MKRKVIKLVSIVLVIAMFLSCFNLMGVAEELENLPNVRTNFNYQYNKKANVAEELERKDALRSPVITKDTDYESKYGEAIERASDYTTYQTSDNKFLTVFDTVPNKYTDENGKEKEIELDIKEKVFCYENTTNSVNIKFAKTFSNKKAVSVSLPDSEYEFSLIPVEGDYTKEVVEDNAILYNNVFENIDVQYTLNELGYKEDIILRAPVEVSEYQYYLDFEGKLEEKEGSVLLYDEQGNLLYTLNAPVMMDANEQTSNDINMSLSKEDDRNIITITANREWLEAEDRVYPVVIDPSATIPYTELQIYNTSMPYNEARVSLLNGFNNNGSFVVSDNIILNSHHTNVAFINVADTIADFLPNNATIDNADLVLNQSGTYLSNNNAIFECRQVNDSWNIGDQFYNNSIIGNSTVTGDNNIVNTNQLSQQDIQSGDRRFEITDTVDAWIYGRADNNGLLVKSNNDAGGIFYNLNAAELYASKRPKIEIEWSLTQADTMSPHALSAHISPIVSKDENDVVSVNGLFVSGQANSHDDIYYRLYCDTTGLNYYGIAVNSNQLVFPDSSFFGISYPQNASTYSGGDDNWQTQQIYTDALQSNKLYQIYAEAKFQSQTVKTVKGDSFVIYNVIQGDTIANISNYYGTSVETIEADNDLENSLLVVGSSLFIRNPKVYEPKDSGKRDKSFDLTNRAHSETVDFATGNFYLKHNDVSIPFYNDSISITRRYNSKAAGTDSIFGHGWQFEYAEFISKEEQQNINYLRSDGTTIQFVYNGTGYVCERGYDLELEVENIIINEDTVQEYTIRFRDGTAKVFDTRGNLKSIQYKGGYSTQLVYDENYKLLKVQSPTGKEYQFEYYTDNKIKKIKLPDNNYLNYSYDEDGNLVEFKDQLNQTSIYTYDSNHRMLSWTDGRNIQRITNTYDSSGKVTTQTDANNNVTQILYYSDSTYVTDPAGQTKRYYYDSFKRTIREYIDSSTSVYYTYNYNNDILTYTDKLGNVTSYTYDSKGNVLSSTRFDGKSIEFTYDENCNLLTKKDYKNYTTTYSYDNHNNLISVTNPDNSIQLYTYDSNGMLTSVTDGNNNTTNITYTADSGLLSSIIYPDNEIENFYHNCMNLLSKKVEADGSQTFYSYDACGRKISEILPGQATTTYSYDATDNLVSITDARGATTTYTYDGECNLLSETDALNNTVSYTYDSLYNQISKTDALGNTFYYTYDNNGKMLIATFDNQVVEQHQYDILGNEIENTNLLHSAYSQIFTYDYRFNQVLRSKVSNRYTDNEYDDNGNLITIIDKSGNEITHTYDSMNRVISTTDANGAVTTVEYDGNGNVTKTIDPLNNITLYTYDSMNNNITITNPNGGVITKTYDSLNRLSSETDAKGNTTEYTYYLNTDKIATKTFANEAVETYSYDLNGNVTEFEDAEGNITTYHYDYLNRLISTEYPNEGIENIEYDANSNITKKTDQIGGTFEYTYDYSGNILSQKDYYNNTYAFEYDINGNLIKQTDPSGHETPFEYSYFGELKKIRNADNSTNTLVYNNLGMRTTDYVDGIKHVYVYDANGNVIQDTVGTAAADKQITTYTYDLNNQVVSETFQGDKTTTYTYDSMGNVTSITDPAGNTIRKYYDLNSNLIKEKDALGREYLYTYDSMNQLIQEKNPLNQTKEYEYDDIGNVTKETDEAGHYVRYTYSPIGKVASKTDKRENTTLYTYDKMGNLIKTTNADGGEIENQYDKNSNLVKVQDALNNITSYTYNSLNQCVAKQLPVGGSYQYEYDVMGNLTEITDPLGNVTSQTINKYGKISSAVSATEVQTNYTYNTIGSITEESTPLGDKEYAYDSYGNLVSETDLLGNETTFTYDVSNNKVTTTDALNNTTTFTYDAVGNKLSETSPLGAVTTYSYDALNRVTSEVSAAAGVTKSNSYSTTGNITHIETTSNGITRLQEFSYDNNGNVTAQTINGVQTQFVYNSMNQKIQEKAVLNNSTQYTTSYTYDLNGNLSTKTAPNNGTECYTYDANGNCATFTDARNNTTEYTYNALGKITKVENALGAETEYSYDSLMNITKVTNALDNETDYTYDDYGRLVSVEDALGNTENYTYNANGFKTSKTDANDDTISYSYDALNRLTEKSYSVFDSVEYEYDAESHRTSMTDHTGETEYIYDLAGRLVTVTTPDDNEVNYAYNGFGDVTQITYPNGQTVQYYYDTKGLLTSLIKGTGYVNYSYNSLNQLTQKSFVDNNTVVNKQYYSYSSTGKVSSAKTVDGNNDTISQYTYTYDLADNIISETAYNNSQTVTKAYTYDAIGQVKTETTTDANNNIISTKSFNYDLVGNQVERSSDGTQTTRVYNANNQLTRTIKGSVITDYTYDVNGNLISEESGFSETEYAYDKENNLLSVVKDDILQMAAVYNGDGDRIMSANKIATPKNSQSQIAGTISGSTVDNTYNNSLYDSLLSDGGLSVNASDYDITTYVNDVTKQNEQVLMEYGASGNVTEEYYYGLQREIYKHDNATEYYMYDGRGSVANLTTSTGAMKIAYSYDTFGEATITPAQGFTGTSNVFDYNAEATDYNTGFQYLRSRYYNPANSTFITQDIYRGNLSNPQTQNRYSYTGNDPVNRKDPSGMSWQGDLLKEIFGGIGKGIVSEIKNSGNFKKPTLSSVFSSYSKDNAFTSTMKKLVDNAKASSKESNDNLKEKIKDDLNGVFKGFVDSVWENAKGEIKDYLISKTLIKAGEMLQTIVQESVKFTAKAIEKLVGETVKLVKKAANYAINVATQALYKVAGAMVFGMLSLVATGVGYGFYFGVLASVYIGAEIVKIGMAALPSLILNGVFAVFDLMNRIHDGIWNGISDGLEMIDGIFGSINNGGNKTKKPPAYFEDIKNGKHPKGIDFVAKQIGDWLENVTITEKAGIILTSYFSNGSIIIKIIGSNIHSLKKENSLLDEQIRFFKDFTKKANMSYRTIGAVSSNGSLSITGSGSYKTTTANVSFTVNLFSDSVSAKYDVITKPTNNSKLSTSVSITLYTNPNLPSAPSFKVTSVESGVLASTGFSFEFPNFNFDNNLIPESMAALLPAALMVMIIVIAFG